MNATSNSVRMGGAYVELWTKSDKYVHGLREAQTKLHSFASSISAIGKTMMIGGGVMAAQFGLALRTFADFGDQLFKGSRMSATTVERFSTMSFAAQNLNVDMTRLAIAIFRLNKNIAVGMTPWTEQNTALRELNLGFRELMTLDPSERFLRVVDALNRMNNAARANMLAVSLFGRAAAGIMPILASGTKRFRDLEAQARSLGLQVSGQSVEQAKQFVATWNAVRWVIRLVAFEIGRATAPAVIKLSNDLLKLTHHIRRFISDNAGLIVTMAKLTAGLLALGLAMKTLGLTISIVTAGLGIVAGSAKVAAAAFLVLKAVMLTSVASAAVLAGAFIGKFVLIGAAAFMVIKTLRSLRVSFATTTEEARTMFTAIKEAVQMGDIIPAVSIIVSFVKLQFAKAWAFISDLWTIGSGHLSRFVTARFYDMITNLEKARHVIVSAWNGISGAIRNAFASVVRSVSEKVADMYRAVAKAWIRIRDLFGDVQVEVELKNIEDVASSIESLGRQAESHMRPDNMRSQRERERHAERLKKLEEDRADILGHIDRQVSDRIANNAAAVAEAERAYSDAARKIHEEWKNMMARRKETPADVPRAMKETIPDFSGDITAAVGAFSGFTKPLLGLAPATNIINLLRGIEHNTGEAADALDMLQNVYE